jgi:hypothetical protein
MDLNRAHPGDEWVGAWALAALDADERPLIEAALAADPEVDAEAARLEEAVAFLAEPDAATPPAGLRSRVLDAALATRPTGAPPLDRPREATPAVELYAAQVERFGAALAAVPAGADGALVPAYGWTIHELARHVLASERYTAAVLGVPGADALDRRPPEHLDLLDAESAAWPLESVRGAARAAAERILAHARGLDRSGLGAEVRIHRIPMDVATLLVVRSFELWTHADDVHRALGEALVDPPAPELRAMSDRSVRGLPGLMLLTGVVPPPVSARVVLTGPGGGTWDVDLSLGALAGPPRATTLVLSALDYCRLASRRLDPDAVACTITGDEALARQLLEASRAIAM